MLRDAGVPRKLSLPDMPTAAAGDGFGRPLLDQLGFANGARFGHHVGHAPYSLSLNLSTARPGSMGNRLGDT